MSDLTYDLRSGSPDFVDRLIAATFAGMAIDCIKAGQHGLMMGISKRLLRGRADSRSALGAAPGGHRDDVQRERFRPYYSEKLGFPIFLTRA